MPSNLPHLLARSRIALQVGSQGAFGELLGSSRHSGQRWERGQATPSHGQLQQLAALVYPKDADLAGEIAAAIGMTLQQLGLVAPPAPIAASVAPVVPPAPPPPDPIHIVDTVVCAAAEAIQLMPAAIRPALRAAFRRARLAGLSVEAVDTALSAPASESEAVATKGR